MDNRTAGVFGFVIAAAGGAVKWADFRAGRASFVLGRGVSSSPAHRDASPRLFWSLTLLNATLIGVIFIASIIGIVWP